MQKHSGPKDTDLEAGLAFSCARTSKGSKGGVTSHDIFNDIIKYTLQWFRFHDVFSLIHIILLFSDALISERPTVPVNVASIQGIDGGKDTCPRCGGQVFHAERMLSKVWPLKHFVQNRQWN